MSISILREGIKVGPCVNLLWGNIWGMVLVGIGVIGGLFSILHTFVFIFSAYGEW